MVDPSNFDLIIFDWAGTMVDFGCRAPILALTEAFARRGVALPEATARADMGRAKSDHVRALLARDDVAAAWSEAQGVWPDEAAVGDIMVDLEPLMRQAAAEASSLIEGAAHTAHAARASGLQVASSTGYTRTMMQPVLEHAARQGYAPDHLVCAGETPQGRPSPLMIYKACAELGVWPPSRAIKVDDAEAGVAEGRSAGCFTIGVAGSGNGVGLSAAAFEALDPQERTRRVNRSAEALSKAGADLVVATVADLLPIFAGARLSAAITPSRQPSGAI